MNLRSLFAPLALAMAVLAGCSTLDYKQREWIFQPSNVAWGGAQSAPDMQDVWIDFHSQAEEKEARLHALWLPAASNAPSPMGKSDSAAVGSPPVMLYLHGARWNVIGSAGRIRRMQEMGFSVLAIDYRGFGKSSAGLPSEATAAEDAQAAWDWIAQRFPGRSRYVFGHSLGGAIAIDLATRVPDASGVIVEGTFTNIADVVSSFKWGWLPVSMLITQRFESIDKVKRIQAPLQRRQGPQGVRAGRRRLPLQHQQRGRGAVPPGDPPTVRPEHPGRARADPAERCGCGTGRAGNFQQLRRHRGGLGAATAPGRHNGPRLPRVGNCLGRPPAEGHGAL